MFRLNYFWILEYQGLERKRNVGGSRWLSYSSETETVSLFTVCDRDKRDWERSRWKRKPEMCKGSFNNPSMKLLVIHERNTGNAGSNNSFVPSLFLSSKSKQNVSPIFVVFRSFWVYCGSWCFFYSNSLEILMNLMENGLLISIIFCFFCLIF